MLSSVENSTISVFHSEFITGGGIVPQNLPEKPFCTSSNT